MFENSIKIEWKTPEENTDLSTPPNVVGYNVYRESGDEQFHRINTVLIKETEFTDRDFVYNVTYRYYVRASATQSSPYTESENSNVSEILAVDTLVPLAPTGLVAIAGEDFVSLSWDANKESDLSGYRVWRRSDLRDEFLALTEELIAENVYTDSTVEKDQRYFYAITALDANGNESQRSEAVSVVLEREGS
jgi:fibronectin type 3 domain-containing protein